MSGGKKKHPKKQTFSIGEVKRAIREAADDAVKRIMLLCIVAARDMFDMDEKKTVEFMEMMQRYIKYEQDGLINLKDASDSLYKSTGIDLRLTRWR